jgi:hypothetical protein
MSLDSDLRYSVYDLNFTYDSFTSIIEYIVSEVNIPLFILNLQQAVLHSYRTYRSRSQIKLLKDFFDEINLLEGYVAAGYALNIAKIRRSCMYLKECILIFRFPSNENLVIDN